MYSDNSWPYLTSSILHIKGLNTYSSKIALLGQGTNMILIQTNLTAEDKLYTMLHGAFINASKI